MPSWLATTYEKQNYVQKRVYGYFSINYSVMFVSYQCFAQPKDTPLRFMALTHTYVLFNGFEERFHQDTMQMHPSTCSYFYSSDLFLCIISPQHRPFIEPNTNKNTMLAML